MTNERAFRLWTSLWVVGISIGLYHDWMRPIVAEAQSKPAVTGLLTSGTATILNTASLSDAVPLEGDVPVTIAMPTAWTAAGMTFQCSLDNITYTNLYDDGGTEVSITVAASRTIALTPGTYGGCRWIKVRSGTSGSPVAQGADRLVSVIGRR